ncbi:MAG: hypothetical protein MHPSP_000430, partial [Paramarteilia canceri]
MQEQGAEKHLPKYDHGFGQYAPGGVLFTYNQSCPQKFALKEAMKLLENGSVISKNNSFPEKSNFFERLDLEIESYKNSNKSGPKLASMKTKDCIFLQDIKNDYTNTILNIFKKIQCGNLTTRNIFKIYPVSFSSVQSDKSILAGILKSLPATLTNMDPIKSFCIEVQKRNNSSFDSMEAKKSISAELKEKFQLQVDYTSPDIVIFIN